MILQIANIGTYFATYLPHVVPRLPRPHRPVPPLQVLQRWAKGFNGYVLFMFAYDWCRLCPCIPSFSFVHVLLHNKGAVVMPLIAWNYVTPGPRKGSVCKKDVVARPPHLHRPAPHLQLLRRWAKGLEIHVLFAKHSFRCRGKGLHMIGQHETQLHLMTWDVIPYISRSESLAKSQLGQMLIFIVGQN